MKPLESKEEVFTNGFNEGTKKGKHHDFGGFFTPYPYNASLRAEWIKGFKAGFKKETGIDYPAGTTEGERIDSFYSQLGRLVGTHG